MKIFFCCLIFICLSLSGCMGKLEKYLRNNISEYREFVVYGQDDGVSASLMCGEREVDYKINGIATELIEFGVLTINAEDETLLQDGVGYVLFVGTGVA